MPKYNSTTACTNSRFHVVNPLRTSSWTSNSIRRRAKRIRRNMGSILSKRSNSGNPNTFCSVPKMHWRSDTWLSVGVAPSTGRQLSPIAGEQFGLLVLGNPRRSRSRRMKRSQADQTTAKNLEEKFDRGEEVLHYFEVTRAHLINPRSKGSVVQTKFARPAKRNSNRRAAVREKSGRYRKKTR